MANSIFFVIFQIKKTQALLLITHPFMSVMSDKKLNQTLNYFADLCNAAKLCWFSLQQL